MSRDRIIDVLNALEAEGWALQAANNEPSNKKNWLELIGEVLEWELVNRKRGLIVQLRFQAVGDLGQRTKNLMDILWCRVRKEDEENTLYFAKRKSSAWRENSVSFAKNVWRYAQELH